MNAITENILREAADAFAFDRTTGEISRYGEGHINDTFVVWASDKCKRYIMQRINSSGFPENEYFEERDDLYDGNPLQPKNRKAIYLNSTNGILACMTFLYSEEELGKRMLTIDSLPAEAVATFQKEDDINIQETYEMVLEDQHCIVLLKFVSTESLQSNQEQAVTRYRASVIDFFEEYTQFLKSQENIE